MPFLPSEPIIELMNQAFNLYQLQKIDTQIAKNDSRLRDIELILSSDTRVIEALQMEGDAKKTMVGRQQAVRTIEELIKALRIKIETSESSLYGGKIRNPKELQDLQNEITSLKKQVSIQEDLQLEAMQLHEESESSFSLASNTHAKIIGEVTQDQATLLGEKSTLEKNGERLIIERQAVLSAVAPENLAFYESLKLKKRGQAVSSAADQSCGTCGATLTAAEWQAARSPMKLTFCPSCGRILYAG